MIAALITEAVKLRRSRLWWITLLGFTVAGGVGTLFMYIGQNPDRARSLGLLGAKAQLATITADWPGHLALLGQIAAIGGVGIFGVLLIWIFGREFSDHTVKDLLALPTSRTAIVLAKFTVAAGWSTVLTLYLCGLGLAGGAALGLPGWSAGTATAAAHLPVRAGRQHRPRLPHRHRHALRHGVLRPDRRRARLRCLLPLVRPRPLHRHHRPRRPATVLVEPAHRPRRRSPLGHRDRPMVAARRPHHISHNGSAPRRVRVR